MVGFFGNAKISNETSVKELPTLFVAISLIVYTPASSPFQLGYLLLLPGGIVNDSATIALSLFSLKFRLTWGNTDETSTTVLVRALNNFHSMDSSVLD